ncbi:MAG TPA: thioredoxin-disulfide reductase [Candidatus Babeliales bacterium]|nr:thioredoxin-disulfide reductase [Candidatus Babeliales bacterium]
MSQPVHKLIIIGAAPAGLTAAIYAARARLAPLVISGPKPGGQLMGTTAIENWPGNISILGPELMANMRQHAAHFGTQFLDEIVTKVDFSQRPFTIWTNHNTILKTQAVIIATGANSRTLNCPGEQEYWGKGVTTCAICDGAFYVNVPIVIIGGGDTSMESALFMLKFTDNITIVQNLNQLTASKIMQERVLSNPKIKIIYHSLVTKIMGNQTHVTSLEIQDQNTKVTQTLATRAIFTAIGFLPNTAIFADQLKLDQWGYISTVAEVLTSVPGVFAAGDAVDFKYRQAVTAAGSGCMAALEAERYLSALE